MTAPTKAKKASTGEALEAARRGGLEVAYMVAADLAEETGRNYGGAHTTAFRVYADRLRRMAAEVRRD